MDSHTKELLNRARQGDAEAFATVFESLRPAVLAVARRLVGSHDAEDVTMETFLKAWQALPTFDGRAKLKSWLYRIAHNCAIDLLRRRQRRREVTPTEEEADGAWIESLPDPELRHPADTIAADEQRQEMNAALAKVPLAQRTALLLRYRDGLSYGEIAAAMEIPLGTVMSRLYNGKRMLRNVWQSTIAKNRQK